MYRDARSTKHKIRFEIFVVVCIQVTPRIVITRQRTGLKGSIYGQECTASEPKRA